MTRKSDALPAWEHRGPRDQYPSPFCYCLQCERARIEVADIFANEKCPHGKPPADCNACDVAADLAYDSAREDRVFGRSR